MCSMKGTAGCATGASGLVGTSAGAAGCATGASGVVVGTSAGSSGGSARAANPERESNRNEAEAAERGERGWAPRRHLSHFPYLPGRGWMCNEKCGSAPSYDPLTCHETGTRSSGGVCVSTAAQGSPRRGGRHRGKPTLVVCGPGRGPQPRQERTVRKAIDEGSESAPRFVAAAGARERSHAQRLAFLG